MQQVILYIQPQLRNTTTTQDFVRVDLMEEDLISLTQVIQDVNDIEKIFTDYSRTFNLPASKTNNKIFKHWYNPDIDGFNANVFCESRIELNHLHFKFGKIQLNEVVMKFGEPSIYKVTFFGKTTDFKNAINEDQLSDLVWLNEFNHNATTANVKNGLENGLNFTVDSVAYNDAIIYPLIAHSQSYIYDGTNNMDSGLNISTNSSQHQRRGIVPEDLKPAITIKNIIKAIEEQYNITFKTGEFLDSAVMTNLYMWLHREKGKMATAGTWIGNSDVYTCSGSNCAELTSTSGYTGYFTLNTGIYKWNSNLGPATDVTTITFEVIPASGYTAVEYSLEIVRANNWESFARVENQSGTSSVVLTIGGANGLNFTVDSVAYNDAIIYPLIAHSQSYIYDETNNDSNGLNISYTNNQNRTKRGVVTEDLKPAVTVKNIIKAIEEQYNITFKTGEFLDSAVMNNLYMWLHREKGKMATAGTWIGNSDVYTCSGSNCAELTSTSGYTGYFTLNTGIYKWNSNLGPDTDVTTITFEVTPASGYTAVEYSLEIVRANNWESFARVQNQSGTSSVVLTIGGANGLNVESLVSFNPNGNDFVGRLITESSIQFQSKFTIVRDFTFNSFDGGTSAFNWSATFTSNSTTLSPQDKLVVITNQLPKLKIKDFLNGLFRQFNLTAYVDFNNEIVVKTLNSYYANGDTQDITQYVKTDQHTVGETIPFSEVDFEYSEPKSILAEQFQLMNNQKYGELNYITDVSKKSIYQIQLPFEHMLFERLQDKTSGALTTVQVGSFLDINLTPNIGQPLLFYGIYQNNVATAINFLDSTRPETYGALCPTGTNSSLDDYWIPSTCNTLGRSSVPPLYNLNFGSEINTYTLTDYSGNNNSLFQTYYQNYITRVFNARTRIFKFTAVLPLKVLLTLTLDDLIVIGTRAYTINKMSIKLQSGETSFELLNEPT